MITRILRAMAPSKSAEPENYTKSQLAYSIYDGRYDVKKVRTSVAPPVQLFHPAFAHFLDDSKSDRAPPDEIIRKTVAYMKAASAIYPSEAQRQNKLKPILGEILEVTIQSIMNEDKTIPDGIVEGGENLMLFLVFLKEEKNEIGEGGSDPSTQAGLSVSRCWAQSRVRTLPRSYRVPTDVLSAAQFEPFRNASVCPTFLFAAAGPWVTILGAVIIDGVIVQRLTDYVWVGIDSALSESHVIEVSRVFYALRESLKRLAAYYDSLKPNSDHPVGSRYFPSITAYRQGGVLIDFEYLGYMENGLDCVTLRARTTAEPRRDVVVKFVDRYGERAHQILADEGLAPSLLYYGSPRLEDGQASYRGVFMVVMEFIDGETFAAVMDRMDKGAKDRVGSEVRRALGILHSNGLVFGDLRGPNIMVTKKGEVKLIDFNWAGIDGQAKYPSLITVAPSMWPDGVGALFVMKREHDAVMWGKLF